MEHNYLKRLLVLLVCLAAIVMLVPSFVAAQEQTSEAAAAVQTRIDAVLNSFGITDDMTDDEIADAIIAADGNTIQRAMEERDTIEADAMVLTEDELLTLELNLYERFWNVFDPLFSPAPAVTPTNVSGVDVTCSSVSGVGTGTSCEETSTGVITVTVTGMYTTRKTTTVTIKNTSGSTATISFDYSASNYDTSEDGGFTLSSVASGTYSAVLDNNGTITFNLRSKRYTSDKTATVTLSNFSVTPISTHNVAVSFNSAKGSVTQDGSAINAGTYSVTDSTFVATAATDAVFVGWIDPDTNKVVSTEASYRCAPEADMKLHAVFTSDDAEAWFLVPSGTSSFMYDDLNEAGTKAAACDKKVIAAADGTLSAGDYTIPAGVTLLIPYDDANTLCTTTPVNAEAYTTPTVYRTLTMASGANITVNGALSLSAQQSSKYGGTNGSPYGPLSFIKMNSSSTITVESGGALYAWGYITGSGSVSIKDGGTVYECFQIADYRGGDATSSIVGNDDTYGVFPFNQYYVQNIEVPMTLYAGATEYGFSAVKVTLGGIQPLDVPFFGADNSMFNINSGYVVKDYVEGTGRTDIKIYGNVSASAVSMKMKVVILGELTIDTSKYALPIPHHFTVSVESGEVTLDQSMAFLPGSELYVKEGANCILGSGKSIYIYDLDQWVYNSGANGYSGTTNQTYVKLKYVPGGDGTTGRLKDALVQVDGTVDATAGSVYVTTGGANIYSTGTGVVNVASITDTVAYQVITADTDISSWPEIAMQPAILQDGDGTDVKTANAEDGGYGAGTYTYYASTQKWCPPGHRYESVVTKPTCTEAGYTTKTCVACGNTTTETGDAATGHTWNWTEGVCTVCNEKAIRYDAVNLSVEGEILLNLKFYIHEDAITNGLSVTVTEEANAVVPAGNTWTATVVSNPENIEGLRKDNDDERYVIYQGIAAGEMTGDVTVQFMTGTTPVPIYDDSTKLGTELTKTVLDYVNLVLAAEDGSRDYLAELKAMCQKAVTFGGYAQLFYGTDTTNPAYKILGTTAPSLDGADAALAEVAATTRSGSNGVTATTQKLNLDSKIYIRTYFTLPNGKTGDNYSITVKGPTNYGKGTFTDTTVKLQYEDASGRWYVDILNVPPMYWDDIYTIEITDSTGTYTVTTSVLAWCARCVSAQNASAEQKNMARAMYFYNAAANAYFTAKYGT